MKTPRQQLIDRYVKNVNREKYDVYIGRGSKWGNPFKIGIDGDREQVIEKYRTYLKQDINLIAVAKKELEGKTLGCHCYPQACHGNVLIEAVYFW